MAVEVPTRSDGTAFWKQETSLDGQRYQFEFRWNESAQSWSLDLADVDGVGIVAGRRLQPDWPILHRNVSDERPPGRLVVVVLDGGGKPGFRDLGQRVKLVYFSAEEIGASA